MLTPTDLFALDDFPLGRMTVSPSRRTVSLGDRSRSIEPRVMQVLVRIAQAEGEVVSRDQLRADVWGVPIGDDSLNRAIAGVRRALEADPAVQLETITRTGYRLVVSEDRAAEVPPPAGMDRRALLGGGVLLLAAGAGGVWALGSRGRTSPADPLVARADRILRDGDLTRVGEARALLDRAVARDRDHAAGHGLLALAHRDLAETSPPEQVTGHVAAAQAAADRALALDHREPHARVALATLRPDFGNWGAVEDALRKVVADRPDFFYALNALGLLLQAVGRSQDSHAVRSRTLELEPNSPAINHKAVLAAWVSGRDREAEMLVDRGLQSWPMHPGLWHARLYLFAFSNRVQAARALLDDARTRPPEASIGGGTDAFWRPYLDALDSGRPDDRERARQTMMAMASQSPSAATMAIMTLSAFGDVDAAYTVCDGLLLRQGTLVASLWERDAGNQVNVQLWRRTMNIFTPPARALRRDPRWGALCDGIGLTDYWQARGEGPDPLPPAA